MKTTTLSPREHEIMELRKCGLSYPAIGVKLGISHNTVGITAWRAMRKRKVAQCANSAVKILLTPRQLDIVTALSQNKSFKEIAADHNLSIKTVDYHWQTILHRFQTRSPFVVGMRAFALGFI